MQEVDKILEKVDKNELVNLALELGNCNSPRGKEGQAGELVFKWLEKNNFHPQKQEVLKDRFNVIATVKGSGGGKSLLFNGHLDTAHGLPEHRWVYGESLPEDTQAWKEGDLLIGDGVVNDKGMIASFLIAAKAIADSGVRLKGDLLLTAVVGEIGGEQIDEFQGPQYLGKGIGSQFLVNHGVVADYALVAELTDYSITWTEPGVVWFKITVKGKRGGTYTPFLNRPYKISDDPNAIVKMVRVVEAIEEWAPKYQEKGKYEFSGGLVVPKANIGAIRGGAPDKPISSPAVCSIYVDVRLPPGKGMQYALHDLQQQLDESKLGFKVTIEPYLFRMGYEGRNVEPLVQAAEEAHRYLFKTKTERIATPWTSMWRDVNVFNGVGIPSITFGPRGTKREGSRPDSIKVDDIFNGAKLYAIIAYNICNQTKS